MAIRIGVQLETASDSDAEELSREAVLVRRRLLELDVESVDFVRDSEVPIGTKAGQASNLGELGLLHEQVTVSVRPPGRWV